MMREPFDSGFWSRQAIYAHRRITLCVELSVFGLYRIQELQLPEGQSLLWPDLEFPRLDAVQPYGALVAEELDRAMDGLPIPPRADWFIPGPHRWYETFYEHLCNTLPAGQESPLPDLFTVDNKVKTEPQLVKALQACRLCPLIPLHRIRPPAGCPWSYPLGDRWRAYFLAREKLAQASNGQGAG